MRRTVDFVSHHLHRNPIMKGNYCSIIGRDDNMSKTCFNAHMGTCFKTDLKYDDAIIQQQKCQVSLILSCLWCLGSGVLWHCGHKWLKCIVSVQNHRAKLSAKTNTSFKCVTSSDWMLKAISTVFFRRNFIWTLLLFYGIKLAISDQLLPL